MTDAARLMFPTPNATDYKGPSTRSPGKERPECDDDLPTRIARMFPTPRASDGAKGGSNQRGSKGDLSLPAVVAKNEQRTGLPGLHDEAGKPIGRTLNPQFVEWLMGFPIGWTDCEGLETP